MSHYRTHTLQIRTPEGVVFAQQLAGPVTRFIAWLIDFAALSAVMVFIGIIFSLLAVIGGEFAVAINLLLFFVLNIGYSIFFEWRWRGQTVGKRIMRLRVVDAQGLRLKFHQIVIRNLLRGVDLLPLVGGAAFILSRRAQRLGDFAANTVVIRIPKLSTPNLDLIVAGKYNSFREHPHLENRLRQRVSAQEASLALQALARRDSLNLDARVDLFADLAQYFRDKVAFPPDATDSLTDEQYVRNVLDTVYRKPKSARSETTPQQPASTRGTELGVT